VSNPFSQTDGVIYYVGRILFDKGMITYLAFILVFALGFALFRTTWGLRTRSIGENPRAADTMGVNVHQLQYTNLAISGVLAGLAGAFLVLEGVNFERGMTSGRGFISLAVMIFGMWRPSRAMIGALIFGFASALQGQLQFFDVQFPHQFIAMLPYVLTLIVLAGFVGRARPPAHVGQAYEVE
jgi:simple sugar transport system permease protein